MQCKTSFSTSESAIFGKYARLLTIGPATTNLEVVGVSTLASLLDNDQASELTFQDKNIGDNHSR